MLSRSVVLVLEGITILAAATSVLVWLGLAIFLLASLIRLWRSSESADPFQWFVYLRSPAGAEVVQSFHFGRRLVRYFFGCIAVTALAGVAAAACAAIFHLP